MKHLLYILCLFSFIFCEEEVTTNDGKKVVLKDDGTWEYVESNLIEKTEQDSLDFGMWTIEYYVDSFGDSTDEAYITNKELIQGRFSNSATTNSDVFVKFLIQKETMRGLKKHYPIRFTIKLIEYGTHVAKGSGELYDVDVKYNKNTFDMYGNLKGDRMWLYGTKASPKPSKNQFFKLLNAFKGGGEVKISLKQNPLDYYGVPSSYSFKIEDATGFEDAYNYLLSLTEE